MRHVKLDVLFKPRSIAVVGASRNPNKIGHWILKNIIESGYRGEIYPVNPNASKILGLTVYPGIGEIGGGVDLAVIAVPARLVPRIAMEAGDSGVKGLIVISAGFKETGGVGIELEAELRDIAREYGMLLVGPNCLGLIDTYTPLNTTFATIMPRRGHLGFISQSGAMITAVLDWAREANIGFSKIVSIGNKALLGELDFIEYLAGDKYTKAILLYVESIDEGRRFIEIAGRVTRVKPIIVLKGGVTQAGAKAAISHTGSLAGRITSYKAAFRKTGVLYASTISELFDYALGLAYQPPPRRDRIAVVSNAGGLCILSADLLVSRGVGLSRFSDLTIRRLREILPPTAAIYNPIDIVGDADEDRYLKTIDIVLGDEGVDLVLALMAPTELIDPVRLAKGLLKIKEKYGGKALITCFVGGEEFREASEYLLENGIPYFNIPERAINSIYGLILYREYMDRPKYKYVEVTDVDREMVESIINNVLMDGRNILLEPEAKNVLKAYGIPVPRFHLAKSPLDAVIAADEIGYPVVMKIVSPDIMHKTDVGGVKIGIEDRDMVEDTYDEILSNVSRYAPNARIYGVIVEEMADEGLELILGVTKDIQFGHLLMFGSGGIYAEIFRDTSFALIPLSREEAMELISSTRIYNIIKGYRGMGPRDVDRLLDIILRLNQLVIDFPEIVEMDINPLNLYEAGRGAVAIDVKIVLERGGGSG